MALLSGYRMLDLSRLMAAPYAAHLLADMGMDVIKVEEPEPRYGMPRDSFTPYLPTPEGERRASAFNPLGRNKRSIALDLLRPELRPRSQELFYRLAERADVVIEGYRPGVLAWMGIDYETLSKINPRIIVCSLSGYGQDGPYVKLAGHAPQYAGVGGVVRMNEAGEPEDGTGGTAGYVNGLFAANAILAAIIERERSGRGQHVDVSMLGALMSLSLRDTVLHARDGELPKPRTAEPALTYLKCADGKYVSTANSESVFWERFCALIERPQYIALRGGNGPEYSAMVEDVRGIFLTKTRDEWLPLLWAADTAAAPVNSIAEALDDPQVRHIGMTWELDHPTEGTVLQQGVPARFSRTPVEFERFAPILGEHTHEVLTEAGFDAAAIADLEAGGIVKSWTGEGWVGETHAPGG